MFRHVLVKAHCRKELSAALNIADDTLRIVRFRPFGTRLAATEFLHHKLNALRSYNAIAAPVKLPTNPEYARAITELTELGERLRSIPASWATIKAATEKKIVEQSSRVSYMEQQDAGTEKELYWVVYLAEEPQNVQHGRPGSRLQQAH